MARKNSFLLAHVHSILLAHACTYIMIMNIPVGSLIRYTCTANDEDIFGIVIENLDEYNATDDRDSVRVCWADDCSSTTEIVESIRDPNVEWMELLSEG